MKEEKVTLKKQGKLPVNARISIDYTSGEPKVKFAYPRKDVVRQVRSSQVVWRNAFFLSLFITFLVLGIYFFFFSPPIRPTNCDGVIGYSRENNVLKHVYLSCDNNFNQSYYFAIGDGKLVLQKSWKSLYLSRENMLSLLMIFTFILFFIFGIRFFAWRIMRNPKKLAKFPEINAKISGRGYYARFKKVGENKILEIPIFKNIRMEYRAIKDFSKYLQLVEIKEHPFSRIIKREKRTFRILKKEKQVTYWYARFIFKEVPKKGHLEVWFK